MIMMVEIDISGGVGVGVGVDDPKMVVLLTMVSCRKDRL